MSQQLVPQTYKIKSVQGLSPEAAMKVHRMNSLGSLFYFIKVALQRRKLTPRLHLGMCRSVEKSRLKDVKEYPRDHFKSTIFSEGLPMWWALPVNDEDINAFQKEGYSDEFIRFMLRVHNPNTRTCLISENLTNATKLGHRTRSHFESNAVFRTLFSDILPTSSEVWTSTSLHVKRTGTGSVQGEGTFDFLGVGGALQSRHYDRVVQDDLVGRKAIESSSIMDKTIEYHRLLIGAYESDDATHENDELIVGNRWAYTDLNSYVKENEPWFAFETHGALGGCCDKHPPDKTIFPEEFSHEKLIQFKKRLGAYLFSCQFLNDPCAPEDADFSREWLRYYHTTDDAHKRTVIKHEVAQGVILKDTYHGNLSIAMAVDPNHAGNAAAGRCRHAIVVVGYDGVANYYLLDYWAHHGSYDTFIDNIYNMGRRWGLRSAGVESVAAQKYLIYHIEQRNKYELNPLKIIPLNGEVENPDGSVSRRKEWRIRNVLSPIFERGNFWVKQTQQEFINEFQTFPRGQFCDILDALAYCPQLLKHAVPYEKHVLMLNKNRAGVRQIGRPYSVGAA